MTKTEQFEVDALLNRIADLEAESQSQRIEIERLGSIIGRYKTEAAVAARPAGQFFPDPESDATRSIAYSIGTLSRKIDALSVKIDTLTTSVIGKTKQLQAAVQAVAISKLESRKEADMATGVQPIDNLVTDVAAENTVIDSAVVLLNGIDKRLADGIAAALAGGATAAQLNDLVTLDADVKANSSKLAAAVQQNTPTPVPPPAAPAKSKP